MLFLLPYDQISFPILSCLRSQTNVSWTVGDAEQQQEETRKDQVASTEMPHFAKVSFFSSSICQF